MSFLATIGIINKLGIFSNGSKLFNNEDEIHSGELTFGKNTISYSGTTLLLSNVTKFEQYGIKSVHKISTFAYITSIVLGIICLFFIPLGLIGVAFFGYKAYMGYEERNRPPIYGLTIELNSGVRHRFFSIDKEGVKNLFNAITHAVENNEPINQTFFFEGDRIKGDKYEFNNSQIERVG